MQTPKFFYKNSLASIFLLPLSLMFYVITKVRNFFIKPQKLKNKFVICVGNVTVGGGGKTPSAILIAKVLKECGFSVCFLSRGYGREGNGFKIVSSKMSVLEVGDEVKILMQTAPVYLFSNYSEVIKNQSSIKEDIIIMDDGLQNPTIIKDYSILVVDGETKFGNGFLLPAGPLRETISSALLKTDAIFNIGGKAFIQSHTKQYNISKTYNLENIQQYGDYFAFCGLAINQKFFSSLKILGLNVIEKLEFEDHHKYTEQEVKNILQKCKKQGLIPITTEKDFVKIPSKYANLFSVVKMTLSFEDEFFLHNISEKINKS